jgi:hypothetical protein
MKKIIVLILGLTSLLNAATTKPTINFVFQHYEGFGGPLINNVMGFFTESFLFVTGGVTYDKMSLIGLSVILSILLGLYTFLKTLDFSALKDVIYDERKPWWNLITKTFLIFILFDALLKPIPMVQMTPIIGYVNSSSSNGLNKGDREILGWLVNDMKTTITNSIDQNSTKKKIEPGKDGNKVIVVVPQIMAVLGYIERIWYGFPEMTDDDIKNFFTVDDSTYKTGSYQIFYSDSDKKEKSLLSCVKEKQSFLDLHEDKLKARIGFDDITDSCLKKLSLGDSFFISFFGKNISSTVISDFFEPIDQMYYYMIGNPYKELMMSKANMEYKKQLLIKSNERLSEINEDDIKKESQDKYNTEITNIDREIKETSNKIFEMLNNLEKETATLTYPKEIALLLKDILTRQSVPKVWRRNLPSADSNKEIIAIKNIDFDNSNVGNNKSLSEILKIEKEYIKTNITKTDIEKININTSEEYLKNLFSMAKLVFQDDTLESEYEGINEGNYMFKELVPLISVDLSNYYDDSIEGVDTIKKYMTLKAKWELTVVVREIILDIVKNQMKTVKNLSDNYKRVKNQCNTGGIDISSCISQTLSGNFVTVDHTTVGANATKSRYSLRNAYAGMYPSIIYSTNQMAKRQKDDNTGSALFLNLNEITEELENKNMDVSVSNSVSLNPLTLSDLPTDGTLWEYIETKTDPDKYKSLSFFFNRLNNKTFKSNLLDKKEDGIKRITGTNKTELSSVEDLFKELVKKYSLSSSVGTELYNSYKKDTLDKIDVTQNTASIQGPKDHIILQFIGGDVSNNEELNKRVMQHKSIVASILTGYSSSEYPKIFLKLIKSVLPYIDSNGTTLVFKDKVSEELKGILDENGTQIYKENENFIENLRYIIDNGINKSKESIAYAAENNVANSTTQPINKIVDKEMKERQNLINSIRECDNKKKKDTSLSCITPRSNLIAFNDNILKTRRIRKEMEKYEKEQTDIQITKMNVSLDDIGMPNNMFFDSFVSPVLNMQWVFMSKILNELREYQNIAMTKVSYITGGNEQSYNIDYILGPNTSYISLKKANDYENKNYIVKNSNFTPSESMEKSFETVVDFISNNKIISGVGLAATVGTTVAANNLFSNNSSIVLKIFFVIIALLFSLIIIIPFLLLIKILTVVVLGVLVGIIGVFRITVLLPISIVIWVLTYNIGQDKTLSTLESLFNYIKKPYEQVIIASKQLFVWVFASFVLGVVLYIGQNVFGPILMDNSLSKLLSEITNGVIEGKSEWMLLITNIVAVVVLYYITQFAYQLILSFISETMKDTPLSKKLSEYIEKNEKATRINRLAKGTVNKGKEILKGGL